MSNSKINKNSITPNGIQVDSEGYTVFYPMGTNKINIPSNSPHWPRGSKLKGLFVYDKDDKLVGFCDTKAMTAENEGIVVMPYEEIVEPPMPTDGYWTPQWIETDTQLICNWVEAEEMEIL